MKGKGVSIAGLIGILFIGLKLTGYITWSWWWVLAPLWAPAVAALQIFAGYAVILVLCCSRGPR